MIAKDTVCAVVVTYNRKELLAECLEALFKQTHPVNAICLIDNASTDGTPEMLKEKGYIKDILNATSSPSESENTLRSVKLFYVRMDKNTGGAGGFYEGIKRSSERGYDWLWIMDDDTIPNADALSKFIESYEVMDNKEEVSILASKVIWTDGAEHKMNIPSFNFKGDRFSKYFDKGVIPIRGASFVSLLLKNEYVKRCGLPIKEYFMWNDDAEYTWRILKDSKGFFVNSSIVLHKTKANYIPWESTGDRFFYEVRNKLWLLRSSSYSFYEKIKIMGMLMKNVSGYLVNNKMKGTSVVAKGIFCGLFYRISPK